MHRLLVALLLAGCTTSPPGPDARAAPDGSPDRAAYFAKRAALLGVDGWHLVGTTSGGLDVTVPAGTTWLSTNYLQIDTWPNVEFLSTDLESPGDRRHLANRDLNVDHYVAIPPGTNVRNNAWQNVAYVWYLDLAEAIAADPRLTDDPETLFYQRDNALDWLPLVEVEVEHGGGGSIADLQYKTLPGTEDVFFVAADSFEVPWTIVGHVDKRGTPLNVFNEGSSNAAAQRSGGRIRQPMPRGAGLELGCSRGSWLGDPNPATAFPNAGSCTVLFVLLPPRGVW